MHFNISHLHGALSLPPTHARDNPTRSLFFTDHGELGYKVITYISNGFFVERQLIIILK